MIDDYVVDCAWSADGSSLAIAGGEGKVALGRAGGDALSLEVIGEHLLGTIELAWQPRGTLFATAGQDGAVALWDSKAGNAVKRWKPAPTATQALAFSPDGKWLAYHSNEGGKYDIYVQPFPATGAKYQVPAVEQGGYRHPRWSPDGKALLYIIGGNVRLRVAGVTTRPDFAFGNATPVTKAPAWLDGNADITRQWDIAPDGQHFIARIVAGALGQTDGGGVQVPQIQVVLNWTEDLKQRVPVTR